METERQSHRVAQRASRGYRVFKNPPQPHMCIQDSIRGTREKLYINVLSWKQIGNARQCAELIPLYGGMQIPHPCAPNCNRPPLTVFAVMVNPEILKLNGKYAPNPHERDALVNLLCDFVEAMNPGLQLARQPVILKDRDLAGELKDVWHAVQLQREKEKLRNQAANDQVTHKIYHIDGPPESESEPNGDEPSEAQTVPVKDGKTQPEKASDPTEPKPCKNPGGISRIENDVVTDPSPNPPVAVRRRNDDGPSAQVTTLTDDNKDIPFVDEYHDTDDDQMFRIPSETVCEMLQNLSMNAPQIQTVRDSPLTVFKDQKKVPLSSRQT